MASKPVFDWHHTNALLRALPAYTEVVLTDDHGREMRLLARDLPGTEGRRFTNLTHGTEWFVNEDGWATVVEVDIPTVSLAVQ